MKAIIFQFLTTFTLLLSCPVAKSQETRDFPFDPFLILKSWDYDHLTKTMGTGEEILATSKNQTYLAGLRYAYDLLGMHGSLEFTFANDSIASVRFRTNHEFRVTSADLSKIKKPDPSANPGNVRAIQKLDSLQKRDSVSRDSVVRAISGILGQPLSNGRTAVSEKNARHSAIWITRGYSCLYKDFSDYQEIVFALSTVPLWAVGEFEIPAGTEILQKNMVSTKKMSWTANLLGYPSKGSGMTYSEIFLLLEFPAGQRYLVSVPKNAIGYLQTPLLVEFASRQRCLLSIPENAIGYLPRITYEDCDGDAIPEAWIRVTSDNKGKETRHYIFSVKLKEPNIILSSDDLMPAGISIPGSSQILVTFQDGTNRSVEIPKALNVINKTMLVHPKGFKEFTASKLNTDGTTDFTGSIELFPTPGNTGTIILQISYKHVGGGWETGDIKCVRHD